MPTNCEVCTHFHDSLCPIQVEGKRVPIHILSKVEETIGSQLDDRDIVKLGKRTEDCFLSPTFLSAQHDGWVKLTLTFKQIYRNCYEMPNWNELVDNVAWAISGSTEDPIWFLNIDLKYAFSQKKLSEATSRQCKFSIVGGTITGSISV